MMSVWFKERAKSLVTNIKKNTDSEFKRYWVHNANRKEIIVISGFMSVFVDLPKTKSTLESASDELIKNETLTVEPVFSIVIGVWIGQPNFLKRNAIKDVFW